MTRRRDILMASSLGAELATRQVFAPVIDALDQPMNDMAEVRYLATLMKDVHAVLDENTPDTADKLWRAARRQELESYDTSHAWKCRALGLNQATTPTLALGGMTPMNVDGWKLAVAIPAPSPMDMQHIPITDIVLIDPKTGNATLFGSKAPQLIEPVSTQKFTVHADAKTWARDFARARLEHVRTAQQARRIANIPPIWSGRPPSALAIGQLTKIDWPFSEIVTAGEGIDPKALARLFRRPTARVHAPMNLRSAA